MERLKVWKNSRAVGYLYYRPDAFEFNYNKDASEEDYISLTMPVSEPPITTQVLPPIFQQNLPEGMLKAALIKNFGKLVDLSNAIDMLKFTAKYKNNYLQVTEENEKPADSPWEAIDTLIEDQNASSIALFRACVEKFGQTSAISGMQPKVTANLKHLDKRKYPALKTDSYVLKFHDEREYFGLVINEYFCLKVAELADIDCAKAEIIEDGNCLAVHRFDKKSDTEFLCMEDFCTLKFLMPEARYNGDYYELIDMLRSFIPPSQVQEKLKDLFKIVALSMKIKNGDAHLKNFSLIYDNDKNIQLAKAYDQVCTTIYIPSDLPALKFNGEAKWPTHDELINYAEICEVEHDEAIDIMKKIDAAKIEVLSMLKDYCREHDYFSNVYEKMEKAWNN